MTLACEDGNSKLVEVVTVADVDDEDHVGNSLLQTRPKPAYGRQGLEWDRRVRIQLRRVPFWVDTFGRIFIFGKQYP